ncbi:probable RCO3 - probable glucose transporter [Cephalotrichum gorgonifer]|uniref:Probable RCO3 - probable glucose transporter n=1 Tax=Cephalotrichum gorgonifer TaxID=2041049 RepID=A0AAE8MYT4_9PEZI|nr:probable RCO3 - probable glucose transporter [Cephalotrichum gorgonifer]
MAIAMGWHKPDNVAGTSAPAIMVGLFVASAGLLFGYDTGSINGILAMRQFKDQFSTGYINPVGGLPDLTTKESSIVVAILSAGTFTGSIASAPVADSFLGRRFSLLASCIVFCLGGILQTVATALPMLMAGRYIAGVGVGAISVIAPLYQSEMAPKWIRGTLVCAYQLSITFGLLISSIISIITHTMQNNPAAYRIPLGLQLVWAVVLSLGLTILPETPRFLVKQGRTEEAGLSLSRLRRLDITHPALLDELQEIVANHEYELSLGPDTYMGLFRGSPHLGRRTFTGCGLQILQQLSGINFIMYYSTTFFTGAGIEDPYTKSLILNVINVVATVPGIMVIESWGRRKLLIIGAIGMAVCQLLIASFTAAAGDDLQSVAQTILIAFCSINISFFAASWGPVAWVVTSEIYPLKVRAKAMSISTSANWALNFAISYGAPFMVNADNGAADMGPKIFFIWGACCIVAIGFVWCMVYETSKISLEQIDEMYERVDHAWNSTRFEPSWSFQQIVDEGWSPSGQEPLEHELEHAHSTSSSTLDSGASSGSSATMISPPPPVATSNSNSSSDSSTNKWASQMGNVDFSY